MKKVLETGFWCGKCKTFIDEPWEWECGECHDIDHWQRAEKVIQTTDDEDE